MSSELNLLLERPLDLPELHSALQSGWTVELYKAFWDVFREIF